MSGFSIGDVFGKTFLSAETIIGGKRFSSETQTFGATLIGFDVPSKSFKDILRDGVQYYQLDHYFRKSDDSTKYVMNPSFVVWNNDRIELAGAHNYGVNVGGNSSSIIKYKIQANKNLGGSGHIGPTTTKDGQSISLGWAANRSDFPNIEPGANANEVIVTLSNNGEYISLDPGADASGIGTFTVKVDGHTFSRSNDRDDRINTKGATPMYLSLISWELQVGGCTDPVASNYKPSANRSTTCYYKVAEIDTFTRQPTGDVRFGDTVNFSYSLKPLGDLPNRRGFSRVELVLDDEVVKDFGRSASVSDSPVVMSKEGNLTYKLRVTWDDSSNNPKTKSLSVSVLSPQSDITCNDANASKYQEASATGDCGPCNSGYSRESSGGVCKKEGCTTDGDYNFDPDAEIHVASMCGGTPAGENGDNGTDDGTTTETGTETSGTSTTTTTTTTTGVSAKEEPEEPGIGKWILPGIGVLAVGAIILMR